MVSYLNFEELKQLAEQQSNLQNEAAVNQTILNDRNFYTPFGQTTFEDIYTSGPFAGAARTVRQQLSPEDQANLNKQRQIQSGLLDYAQNNLGRAYEYAPRASMFPEVQAANLGQYNVASNNPQLGAYNTNIGAGSPDYLNASVDSPYSFSGLGLGQLGTASEYAKNIGDTFYEQGLSRLKPTLDKERRDLELRLRAQGIDPTSTAGAERMQALDRSQNDLLSTLANNANLSSVQAGTQLQGADIARNNQLINQYSQERANPIQEIGNVNAVNASAFANRFNQYNAPRQAAIDEASKLSANDINQQTFNVNRDLQNQQAGIQNQQNALNMYQQETLGPLQIAQNIFGNNPAASLPSGQVIPVGNLSAPNYLNAAQQANQNVAAQQANQTNQNSAIWGSLGNFASNAFAPYLGKAIFGG